MRLVLMFAVILALTGCNTDVKRLKRGAKKVRVLQTKFPELFDERRDTLIYLDTISVVSIVPELDTVIQTVSDTIIAETERVTTKVIVERDTIPIYHINTVVRPDTIEVVRRDTVFFIKHKVVNEVVTKSKVPWRAIAAVIISLLAVVFLIIKVVK